MSEFNWIKKSFDSPNSLRNAVNAMCCHCMGCAADVQGNGFDNHLEPGYAQNIRDCSAPHCPLHRFRPFQQKEAA